MPKTDTEKATRRRAQVRNRAFIVEVNARTTCAHCGAQPVEWHNPEHVELKREQYRISKMVSTGKAIASIEAELARCTPLCRRCHMAEDGRLRVFVRAAGNRLLTGTVLPPKPCATCQREYKPLRRGLCGRCWERTYRPGRNRKAS